MFHDIQVVFFFGGEVFLSTLPNNVQQPYRFVHHRVRTLLAGLAVTNGPMGGGRRLSFTRFTRLIIFGALSWLLQVSRLMKWISLGKWAQWIYIYILDHISSSHNWSIWVISIMNQQEEAIKTACTGFLKNKKRHPFFWGDSCVDEKWISNLIFQDSKKSCCVSGIHTVHDCFP